IAVAKHLDNLLQHDMFETSTVGMMVYDLDADSVLYSHNARLLLRPASTMKLVTAIAAIDRLGGSYQFKTELCYTGEVSDRTLTGDIYCVGGFDPRFNSDDMRAFVESIRKMGVDTIRGNIYADKSMKDDNDYGEGWCWDDDNPVLSPLLVSRRDIFVQRFVEKLIDAGIVVESSLGEAVKPANAFCICHRFHTMDQVLMNMLKDSDNLYAEAMFYQIAASTGVRHAGAKQARGVIKRLVRKIGLDPDDYSFADGSGLSLYNYVSAELEVAMLRYAYSNGNILLHLKPSMPIAATDGTLRDRMHGSFTNGNVCAKTGTVTGVSSLAGYCTAANGHALAFSIINNGLRHTRNGRAFQDKVCTELCRP
ncbi:MAG: D-alanyl-D-alanine carboxypeptidase/D-alanyl-D-alanine-endopeptidase, partial [Prevotellaceae bacterium]|nr:D-alanyl-D-alanine carboxypeptidase/D-alanyl-D-alanine-endopeptidase [Prevotellaceae bacterium]